MPLTLDQFIQHLGTSGLMTEAEARAVLDSLPDENKPQGGEQLARELIRLKKLTAWQASAVYQGKTQGLVLGKYTILDKLGEGGMGTVLKAYHRRMNRVVALKVLSPSLVKKADSLKRFLREVQAAAKLLHPNIVPALDADEAKGAHFLVMEYVEGTDLAALVKKDGPLPVEKAVGCILQAAQGLAYAHERGVIHRDVKPANLLLDLSGTVKILDMGLARMDAADAGQSELTTTGAVMGTVDYMSPEQALNTKHAGPRSDIYSLGITLWYLLTGRPAYAGTTLMEKLLAHRDEPIPSLCAARPDVPNALDAIFARMVAKHPDDRYQSMNELLAALPSGLIHDASPPSQSQGSAEDERFAEFIRHLERGTTAPAAAPQSATAQRAATLAEQLAQTVIAAAPGQETDPKVAPITRATGHQGRQRRRGAQPSWKTRAAVWGGLAAVTAAGLLIWSSAGRAPPTDARAQTAESGQSKPRGGSPSGAAESSEIAGSEMIPVPPDYAAERKAATWLASEMREGSSFHVHGESGAQFDVTAQNREPPRENFTITTVALYGPIVGDECFTKLAGCSRLWKASFASGDWNEKSAPGVTNTGLAALARMTGLVDLRLANMQMKGSLFQLLFHWPRLRVLELFMTGTSDADLDGMPATPQLESLSIAGTRLSNAGLLRLVENCPNLKSLGVQSNSVGNDRTLLPLRSLRALESIACDASQVTDEGVDAIMDLPALDSIVLEAPTGGGAVTRLARLGGKLRHFRFYSWAHWDTSLSSEDYEALPQCRNLERLDIQGHKGSPDDASLEGLARLPALKFMDLRIGESFRNYTPAGIARFRGLRPDVALVADEAYPPVRDYQPRDIQNTLPPWPGVAGNLPAPMLAPRSPAQATEHQAAWARALKRDVASLSTLGMKFALIPPGEFDMILSTATGLSARDVSQPVIRTRLPRPFELATTEVTVDQFRQFIDATGYVTAAEKRAEGGSVYGGATRAGAKPTWRNPTGQPADPRQPVTQVTAEDALALCAWLSQTQRGTYRLPTEAEFMHALLAGSQSRYAPADRVENADRVAIFGTAPAIVGSREANPFGLFDMLGNVWEFCEASGAAGLFDAESRRPFPRRYNLVRGLGFNETIQSTCWNSVVWSEPQNNLGFRVVRELPDLKGVEAAPAPGDAGQLVRRGQPLSSKALVPRPAPIAGLRSWSVELKSPQSRGTVSVLAAQPTGNLVATGNNFGKISLWDEHGNLQQVLLGHEGVIHSLDFSADGNWLVSCDRFAGPAGSTARVWEVATGRQAAILPVPGWCWAATIAADGSRVAAMAPGGVLLWDRATQKVSTAANIRDLAALTWTPDGAQLIGSHGNLKLRVYDATTLESIREADGPATQSLKVSPDGRWLAVGTDDAGVAIWERETLTPVRTLAKENAAQRSRAFAWLPDSQQIAVAFEAHPSAIYDTASGKEIVRLPIPTYSIAIRDSGREVVLDAGYGPVFADASTGRLLREAAHVWPSGTARLAPGGGEIWCAIGSDLAVHDAETGQRLRSHHVPVGSDFEWMTLEASPAGDRAALISARPSLPVIDPASGEVVRTVMHGSANVHQAAWSPDGTTLATTASDHLVRLWNVETGAIAHTLKGHTDKVWSVAWSRDGRRLASAAEDQSVRIWDARTGKPVATFDRLPETMPSGPGASRNLVWADTRRLWIGLRSSITQLDVEGGWFTPVENFSQGNNVDNLALAPNGRQLLIHEAYNFTFLRGWSGAGDRTLLGDALGGESYRPHTWHPDSRRFLADQMTFGVQGYDTERSQRLGHFFPQIESLAPNDGAPQRRHWLCLGPTGHFRGGPCDVPQVAAGLPTSNVVAGLSTERRAVVAGSRPVVAGLPTEPRATTEGLLKTDAAANDSPGPTTDETLASLADLIVYVALHEDGTQRTYSPDEFAQTFKWHNDPDRATLLKLDE